jgi:hypothetical protein
MHTYIHASIHTYESNCLTFQCSRKKEGFARKGFAFKSAEVERVSLFAAVVFALRRLRAVFRVETRKGGNFSQVRLSLKFLELFAHVYLPQLSSEAICCLTCALVCACFQWLNHARSRATPSVPWLTNQI